MMRRYSLVAAALMLAATPLSPAADKKVKQDQSQEGITRQQADAILNELREMRLLLEKLAKMQPGAAVPTAPSAPRPVSLKLGPGIMIGNKNAALTMVEYIDLQCPFCKQFDDTTFAQIRKNMIDTGKVRYYSRDFPLDMHANARKAAVAAHCANEQGQFWRMRQVLLAHANNLAPDAILGYAKTAGLNTAAFTSCFNSTKYDEQIRAGTIEGSSAGVQGTPSFLIGKSTPDGVTGSVVVGAQPYAVFESEVKKLEAK